MRGNDRVSLLVVRGDKVFKVSHSTEHRAAPGDDYESNRYIRELIRQVADAGARAFPDPRSPYSDDLFKIGPDKAHGVTFADPQAVDNEDD